jgi:drug/metabolite transporter (DMT)-like permease
LGLLAFGFRLPTPIDAAMLLLGGVSNACAQYGWTKALSLAPTAAVSPFYYVTLFWAVAIGLVVWGDLPSVGLMIGAAIIVASGLMLLFHETRRRSASA